MQNVDLLENNAMCILNEGAKIDESFSIDNKVSNELRLPVNIPEIEKIAQRLNKISLLSPPDPKVLNVFPESIETSVKVQLHPIKSKNVNGIKNSQVTSLNKNCRRSRKDPKFVPYEPYKGCVKPIFKENNLKSNDKSKSCVIINDKSKDTSEIIEDDSNKLWDRVSRNLNCFFI